MSNVGETGLILKRPWKRWGIGTLVALFPVYMYWSSIPDPRFALAKLQGLTPGQVIGQLGPPAVDPRLAKWGGWTPNNNAGEPLILFYSGGAFAHGGKWNWPSFTYGVVFKNNRVVDVTIGHH